MSKQYRNEPFYRVFIGPKTIISFEKPDHLGVNFYKRNFFLNLLKLIGII